MFLDDNFYTLVDEGQELLSNSTKTLVYQARPDLFEKIDFENNLAYLEPFVFSYFHNRSFVSLDELLYGYVSENNRSDKLDVKTRDDNKVFLPQVGLLNLVGDHDQPYQLHRTGDQWKLKDQHETIKVAPIQYLGDSEIELFSFDHPFFENYFFEWDNNINNFSSEVASYTIVSDKYYEKLAKAIDLLKRSSPDYFQSIEDTNKRIVLFDNLKIRNFAVREMHGMAFIGASEELSEIYYLEEIIHQCGHNIFNAATADLNEFFKIDPETNLGVYSGNKNEYRSIYSSLHGLFTIAARIYCFQNLLNFELPDLHRHELLGRLADLKRRFRTGLEFVKLDECYTQQGADIYQGLEDYCAKEFEAINPLVASFNYSNQSGPDFNYNEFQQVNDLDQMPVFN